MARDDSGQIQSFIGVQPPAFEQVSRRWLHLVELPCGAFAGIPGERRGR